MLADDAIAELPITLHGRYRVEAELGRGAMGTVYRGRHLALDIPIAIKVLHPHLMQHPEIVRRTLEEARTSAQLTNENVIRVFDVAQLDGGAPFIVMELLNGCTLAEHLARHGRLSVTEAVAYMCQVCLGLADAHSSGVIHRDLKPENLFRVERGERIVIKILDFGISKAARPFDVRITLRACPLGTPAYMSPEQMIRPDAVDERSDIWALGVVLYELLCGQVPFPGDNFADIALATKQARVTPLRSLAPEVPVALEELILRCLSHDPADRPGSADELFRLLVPFIEDRASGVRFLGTSQARSSLPGIGAQLGVDASSSYPNVSGTLVPLPEPRRLPRALMFVSVLGMVAGGFGYMKWRLDREAAAHSEVSVASHDEVDRTPPRPLDVPQPLPTTPIVEKAERTPPPPPAPVHARAATKKKKTKKSTESDEPEVIFEPEVTSETVSPPPEPAEESAAPPEEPSAATEFGGRS